MPMFQHGVLLLSQNWAHKKNHFMWKEENKGKNVKRNQRDDDDVIALTSDDLIILCDHESDNLVYDENKWIVYSATTLHVT